MEGKLEKKFNKIMDVSSEKKSTTEREIIMFDNLSTIHNSTKDYIILTDGRIILNKNQIDALSDGAKIHWILPLRLGLTGDIGIKFLDYFKIHDQDQYKAFTVKFNTKVEKIPEQFISVECRRLYFFACLSGRFAFNIKECKLVPDSSGSGEKSNFIFASNSDSQALKCYYNWILYPLFLYLVPEVLRKKFWKTASGIPKLILQCQDPQGYLPLERLKVIKNFKDYKVHEKTKFCTKEFNENTLNFIGDIISYTVSLPDLNLNELLEDKVEQVNKLLLEIQGFNISDVTFDNAGVLISRIKEYEKISKKELRDPIKPEDRKKLFPDDCFVCKIKVNIHNGTAGHIEAASHNGSSKPENLVPLCSSCNSKMGNVHLYEYLYLSKDLELIKKIPILYYQLLDRYQTEKKFLINMLTKVNFQKKDFTDILNNGHLPISIRFKVIDLLFQLFDKGFIINVPA